VNWRHLAILAGWSLIVMLVVGALLFPIALGDCFDNEACKRTTNRDFTIVAGSGFVVYWLVFIVLVRKWTR
jgi:hypothetical protein